MQQNHYGGQTYPANQIIINEASRPDFNPDGTLAAFYDFNNVYWRASDIENRYAALKRETAGKPVTVWLVNLDSEQRSSVKADYEHIWATGAVTLLDLWGAQHRLSIQDEPEVASLLVHEQDYINESQTRV